MRATFVSPIALVAASVTVAAAAGRRHGVVMVTVGTKTPRPPSLLSCPTLLDG
jgi:hypothetical protein